jgi:hypothetical protein
MLLMATPYFPDGLRPTTAVGLFDKSIADPGIRKRFFCRMEGGSGCFRAMMSPKPALAEALIAGPHSPPRGSPFPFFRPGRLLLDFDVKKQYGLHFRPGGVLSSANRAGRCRGRMWGGGC